MTGWRANTSGDLTLTWSVCVELTMRPTANMAATRPLDTVCCGVDIDNNFTVGGGSLGGFRSSRSSSFCVFRSSSNSVSSSVRDMLEELFSFFFILCASASVSL